MERWYEVTSPGGDRTTKVKATNAQQAKRKACKVWGYRPSDYFTGISAMRAKQIRDGEEVDHERPYRSHPKQSAK